MQGNGVQHTPQVDFGAPPQGVAADEHYMRLEQVLKRVADHTVDKWEAAGYRVVAYYANLSAALERALAVNSAKTALAVLVLTISGAFLTGYWQIQNPTLKEMFPLGIWTFLYVAWGLGVKREREELAYVKKAKELSMAKGITDGVADTSELQNAYEKWRQMSRVNWAIFGAFIVTSGFIFVEVLKVFR